MKITLLAHTPSPVDVVAQAAAICRRSTPSNELVAKIIAAGHESVLEHVSFTFRVEGISRACLAQLTRHRIASYSVESQRSVDCAGNECMMPMWPPADSIAILSFQVYRYLVDTIGVPKEDARLVLPEGTTTNLIFTMNARELRHCFRLRLSKHAQWEIRLLFESVLNEVMSVCSELFPEWSNYTPELSGGYCCPYPLQAVDPYYLDDAKVTQTIRNVQCVLTELYMDILKGCNCVDSALTAYDGLVRAAAVILAYAGKKFNVNLEEEEL